MKTLAKGLLLALALPMGCGGEDPVPAKPTWFEDVQPILRGNCFGCHGDTYQDNGEGKRLDIYDDDVFAEFADLDILVRDQSTMKHLGAKGWAPQMYTRTHSSALATRMPPPPATHLSDRDVEVFDKWAKTGRTLGTRADNHKPEATLIATRSVKGGVEIKVVVEDQDQDQVIGRLSVIDADDKETSKALPRTGQHTIVFSPAPKAPYTVKATLHDGTPPHRVLTLKP